MDIINLKSQYMKSIATFHHIFNTTEDRIYKLEVTLIENIQIEAHREKWEFRKSIRDM